MKYFLLFAVFVLVLSLRAFAQVPNKISYQGLLTTSAGAPVTDGSYELDFKIYNVPSGGSILFFENHPVVAVQRGTFNVILGYIPHLPLPDIFNQPLFVEVTAMSGPGISTPITFSPRSELTSAPYSLAPWSTIGSNISFMNGNVGIGTTSPWEKLHVSGSTRVNSLLYLGDGLGSPNNNCAIDVYNGKLRFLNFNASPSEVMTIHNTGNVGIGTTNPQAKLEIGGTGILRIKPDPTIAPTVRLVSENDFSRQAKIEFWRKSGGSESNLWMLGNDLLNENTTNFSIHDAQAGLTRLYINSDGNVGIGTTNPQAKLEIGGTGILRIKPDPTITPTVRLVSENDFSRQAKIEFWRKSGGSESNLWMLGNDLLNENTTNFSIHDAQAGQTRLYINSAGNVGIGTTSPNHILDVQGVEPRIFVGTGGAAVGLALSHQGTAARRYDLLSTGGSDPIAAGRFTIRDITGGGLDRLVINSNGHVGIGTANPQGALDVSSTTGAFVVPRMTTVQRDALTPINGMIIYNTTTNQFNFRENGAWVTK